MNRHFILGLMSFFLISVFCAFGENAEYGALAAKSDVDLTIEDMLTYALQDEYIAHGEYALIISKFGNAKPYDNIVKAEVTHINMIIPVLKKLRLPVPQDNSSSYLVTPATLRDAAQTGVQAELDNIAMYETFLMSSPVNAKGQEEVKSLFIKLRDASKSHLAAFRKQL